MSSHLHYTTSRRPKSPSEPRSPVALSETGNLLDDCFLASSSTLQHSRAPHGRGVRCPLVLARAVGLPPRSPPRNIAKRLRIGTAAISRHFVRFYLSIVARLRASLHRHRVVRCLLSPTRRHLPRRFLTSSHCVRLAPGCVRIKLRATSCYRRFNKGASTLIARVIKQLLPPEI
jgi:hypothetical protein